MRRFSGSARRIEPVARLDYPTGAEVHWVEFGLDGRTLLCAAEDGSAAVYELAEGRVRVLPLHAGPVHQAGFIEGGRELLAAGSDSVSRWDLEAGTRVRAYTAEGDRSGFRFAAHDADRDRVIAASFENTVYVWDGAGRPLRSFDIWGYTGGASAVVPGPDHRFVLSVDEGYTLTRWSVETGEPDAQFEGFDSRVGAVAMTPDSRRLVSAHRDASLRTWDLGSGELLEEFLVPVGVSRDELEEEGFQLPRVSCCASGRVVVALERGAPLVLDLGRGVRIVDLDGLSPHSAAVALAADGTWGAAASGRVTAIWSLAREPATEIASQPGEAAP